MTSPRIALVTARAARDLDEDLPPLFAALRGLGAEVAIADWDDAAIDWSRFDLSLLRSTWDYTERLPGFLAWAERTAACTTLLNPLDVLRWNVDKHYLADLERSGVAIVPSTFVEPGQDARIALDTFLGQPDNDLAEFVIKPCIGAGSRDAQRHGRAGRNAALAHLKRLLDAGRSALLQPYLERVDEHGETALIFFDGRYSHAIRKGPLLRRGDGPTEALFAAEEITARVPAAEEHAIAESALAAIPFTQPLLYARVDLIHDGAGAPRLLELELAEPSLFFAHAPGSVERFAQAVYVRAGGQGLATPD
jgi:glutathione synthase/RimK-type ligase-like ATP-grasp enzyme